MKQLAVVAFLVFILSLLSFGRQIYDSETGCLNTDYVCPDDAHVFKDDEIVDEDDPQVVPEIWFDYDSA